MNLYSRRVIAGREYHEYSAKPEWSPLIDYWFRCDPLTRRFVHGDLEIGLLSTLTTQAKSFSRLAVAW